MQKSKLIPAFAIIIIFLVFILGVFIGRRTNLYSPTQNIVQEQSKTGEKDTTPVGMIDINKASAEDFAMLNGIGSVIAERIVAYRIENGSFKSIEDIKNVPGIGDVRFNQIKDYITVGG